MFASHYASIAGEDPSRSPIPAGASRYPASNRVQYKNERLVDREGRGVPGGGWKHRNREAMVPMLNPALEAMVPMLRERLQANIPIVTTPRTVNRAIQAISRPRENMTPPMLRQERFSPNMPYPDQYYVYTPYISEKSTIPHLNPPVNYPSLSRNILPGTTTRYEDQVYSEPYWYRDYTPATYEQTWDYQIDDQREYLNDMARARRMRNLQ